MNTWSKVALLSLAVTTTFGTMIVAPAVKLLAVAFPDTSTLLIQWVVTLSSIFILPTLFLVEPLSRRFNRKSILIAGLLLYLLGGIGPALSNDFTMILVFRALLGLGIGLIAPTFNTLIAQNFQGGERTKMMGFITSVNGIGGALFLSVGGFIATLGWRAVFVTYVYTLILLLLVVFLLPKFPPEQKTETIKRASGFRSLPPLFYAVILAAGLHTMVYMLVPTRLSLYLADTGIGDVTSVGYLTALSLIGIFASGAITERLTRLFGHRLVPFSLLVMALGFLLLGLAQSVIVIAAAAFLIGFAEGVLYPVSFARTADVVPKESVAKAIPLLLACIYMFQFLCPVILQSIETLFRLASDRALFDGVAGALVFSALGFGLYAEAKKRHSLQSARNDAA